MLPLNIDIASSIWLLEEGQLWLIYKLTNAFGSRKTMANGLCLQHNHAGNGASAVEPLEKNGKRMNMKKCTKTRNKDLETFFFACHVMITLNSVTKQKIKKIIGLRTSFLCK